jgi:Na+-translocating ferredoxin:NAD+ oxidoreductase RnfG subunit
MKNLHNVLSNFRTVIIFLLLVALITVIFGTIYATVKQTYRNNANDPQVEVVDQVASLIEQDIPLDAILGGSDQVDMSKSLGLFVMIFDKDKKLISASAQLDGQTPTPPDNTFERAKQDGENRFTWEPKDGVRIAAVLKAVDDKGYVLAGRSLREVENRQQDLIRIILISWIVAIPLALLLTLALKPRTDLTFIEETSVTVNEGNSSN